MTEIQNAYGSVDWAILKNIFKIIRLALLGNKTYYAATVFKTVRFGFNNRQIREIKQREFINTLNTCSYLIYDRWHPAQWGKVIFAMKHAGANCMSTLENNLFNT